MKIVVAVSGASGAPYAKRLLDFLAAHAAELGVHVDLVFTETGRQVWAHELGTPPAYPWKTWDPRDFTAPFASGSAGYDAMVVIPCSAGALSRIAHGLYNRVALPILGRVLSPDPEAYRYLVQSMERFASMPEFLEGARRAGFRDVKGVTLFPGVCGLVTGIKA